MAVVRLANGHDVSVKLSVADVIAAVRVEAGVDDFVELPGEDGQFHVRPAAVIAVIEDARRSVSGFRMGTEAAPGKR